MWNILKCFFVLELYVICHFFHWNKRMLHIFLEYKIDIGVLVISKQSMFLMTISFVMNGSTGHFCLTKHKTVHIVLNSKVMPHNFVQNFRIITARVFWAGVHKLSLLRKLKVRSVFSYRRKGTRLTLNMTYANQSSDLSAEMRRADYCSPESGRGLQDILLCFVATEM